MNEFDIELDSDIGTSVSKIKNNIFETIKHSETEIDYDKVMEILHNSETNNSHGVNNTKISGQNEKKAVNSNNTISLQPTNKVISYVQDVRPKREINMNKIVKNIESNIDNFTKNTSNQNNNHQCSNIQLENFSQIPQVETIKIKQSVDQKNELTKHIKWDYFDVILYVLIFILLNNKFIIELIYDCVPYIKNIKSPYPNLLLRSLVFGVLIFLIKKFNL